MSVHLVGLSDLSMHKFVGTLSLLAGDVRQRVDNHIINRDFLLRGDFLTALKRRRADVSGQGI